MRTFIAGIIAVLLVILPAASAAAQEPPEEPAAVVEEAAEPTNAELENVEQAAAPASAEPEDASPSTPEAQPSLLAKFNGVVFSILFYDISFGLISIPEVDFEGNPVIDPESGKQQQKSVPLPFLIVFLAVGSIFFTFWFRWINLRGLKHSIEVIAGRYDRPEDEGEISHFRALTSALSATVGLGNIAGVAVAIQLGGPGAVVWMSILAVFSMSAKFSSCTLAQMYRQVNPDGSISGGPMYYIDIGWRQFGKTAAPIGKLLAVIYALCVMGGAIGGGNMFQANQTTEAIITSFGLSPSARWIIGPVMAALVALVILGGIKRIGAATSRIVPAMCTIYVIAALYIIFAHITEVPATFAMMIRMAFTDNAFFGGAIGVLMTGVQRAVFSNEGGLGSAAIAHAAAKTDEPVREGMVAMIGPVIDTIIVCNMTALVVIITGVWADPEVTAQAEALGSLKGVAVTAAGFGTVIPWFPYVLTVCVALFAYSTMISWCYYGERGWIYLLDQFGVGKGLKTVVVFRLLFVCAIILGAVEKLANVLDFSDAMILSMAFPNILGSVFLAPKVLEKMRDYWHRYQTGQIAPVK